MRSSVWMQVSKQREIQHLVSALSSTTIMVWLSPARPSRTSCPRPQGTALAMAQYHGALGTMCWMASTVTRSAMPTMFVT